MQITADQLNGSHLGRTIAVLDGKFSVMGTLSAVHHEADILEDRMFHQPAERILGRPSVTIELLEEAKATLRPDATVSLAD